jgi:hypothetical protein
MKFVTQPVYNLERVIAHKLLEELRRRKYFGGKTRGPYSRRQAENSRPIYYCANPESGKLALTP